MKRILSRITKVAAIFAFAMTMLVPAATSAAVPEACGNKFLGFPHWYEYLELNAECEIVGPKKAGTDRIDGTATATRIAIAVIDILLRVAGLVAFAFIVYAGFQFVLSTGDTNKEVAARQTIINAVIGMLITIFATAIVTFVGRTISK